MNEEGWCSAAYRDASGHLTIGVGHLLTKDELASGKVVIGDEAVRWTDGLTYAQASALLEKDVRVAEDAINNLVTVELYQHQFDALVSLVFNIGVGAFKRSTLLKRINGMRLEEVPREIQRWTYSGGVVLAGLVDRRRRESHLWNGVMNA